MLCLKTQRDYNFKLILLDDREFKFTYKGNQKCEQILVDIAKILSLEERNYFSFKYNTNNSSNSLKLQWVDLNKTIHAQFKATEALALTEIFIYLSVKYYINDPCKLGHELTRYLFYLQLRKDIGQGRLFVPYDYAVDLYGYFLQGELGDFNPKRDVQDYAAEYEFLPNQTVELEKAAESKHMKLKGMSQATAEMNFLNKAKWLDMYGVDMHRVLDESSTEHAIGLSPTGISVYKTTSSNKTTREKISSYFWPRIKKLNFRHNRLMLTVINKTNEEKTHTFFLDSKCECKQLWKSCVEQHRFFKINTVYEEPALINTAQVMSKQSHCNGQNNGYEAVYIKRVPAKRIRRKSDGEWKGFEAAKQLNNNVDLEQIGQSTQFLAINLIEENGDLLQNDKINSLDSPGEFLKTIDLNQIKQQQQLQLVSPTKSVGSYKYNVGSQRRESAGSENDSGVRRRHHGRNRSKTRRRSGTNADNNPENQGDDYNHNEQTNFRFANTDQTTEDSDTNLIKQSQKNDPPTHRPVYRSSSQTSTASRRHHHHHHHRRTNSKSSNKNVKQGLNCDEDAMRMIMRRERSRKSLHHNTNNQQSETCHETSADENEEEILRRQVRRRKRSKSPGDMLVKTSATTGTAVSQIAGQQPPDEIRQHIKYDLVVPSTDMSADQLREIPFVKVETAAPPFRISPHQKHRRFVSPSSSHRRKSGDFLEQGTATVTTTTKSSSVVAYVRDGTAQIAKTSKLVEIANGEQRVVTSSSASIMHYQATTAEVNSKLINFKEETNIGLSTDSGCEDMNTNMNALMR